MISSNPKPKFHVEIILLWKITHKRTSDVKSKKVDPLTFNYGLFEGFHVPNINLTKCQSQTANERSFIFRKPSNEVCYVN